MYDVIIIGGGYAGMAAALQLARARRSCLVLDKGERRNRFASQSHGFLGQDGVSPSLIADQAREQLLAYPDVSWRSVEAVSIMGATDNFTVETGDGDAATGRRILFATGVHDELPDIPGLAERWGQSVFHCPYCHGYELDQGRIGVIGASDMSAHQAELLTDWGDVTFLINQALTVDEADAQRLSNKGVVFEPTPIARIEDEAKIVLTDGRTLSFAGLFVASRVKPASALPHVMGCMLERTPIGYQLQTDRCKQTSVDGVYACGDLARAPHSLSLAVGDGALAGAMVHQSLVWA